MSPRACAAVLALGLLLSSERVCAQKAQDPDPFWGPDKALHLGVSAAITGGGYGLSCVIDQNVGARAAIAASIGIGAGLAKEVADALGLGTPSWKDFLWDVIGTGISLSLAVSLDLGVRAAEGR